MKIVLLLGFGLSFPPALIAAEPGQEQPAAIEIQKTDTTSAVKRIFSRLWAKLRAYVPKPGLQQAATRRTQIAGVRGAETTTSQLQPYWKGDKTADPRYVEEVEAFHKAMTLADAGELTQAAEAFREFRVAYPTSSLNPNVQFALAMIHGQLGDDEQAITMLRTFAQNHPTHPLTADANELIAELQRQ